MCFKRYYSQTEEGSTLMLQFAETNAGEQEVSEALSFPWKWRPEVSLCISCLSVSGTLPSILDEELLLLKWVDYDRRGEEFDDSPVKSKDSWLW